MKKSLCVLILCSVLALPVVALAEDAGDACMQAQIDAERDVNTPLWLGAGCLFGIFGVGAAYLIEPSPSAIGLMGKSSEYVMVYTDCYKDKGRSVQTNKALIGCLVGAGVYAVTYLIFSTLIYIGI